MYANQLAKKTLRLSLSQIRELRLKDLRKMIVTVNQETYRKQLLPFEAVYKTKQKVVGQRIRAAIDDDYLDFEVDVWPLLDDAGKLEEILVSFRDITNAAKQREFQRMYIKLLGHELKQPLGLMRAYLYYFRKYFRGKSERVSNYVEKLDVQISYLAKMLTDITDATRFSMNVFTIKPAPTDLERLVRKTVAEIATSVPNRVITVATDGKEIAEMEIDEVRIRQALANLINNALKYSKKSRPVEVSLESSQNHVLIKIKDRGRGIKKAELKHIFEPYYRTKFEQNKPGLGLGLALVKNIIERHGGEITVESRYRQGSAFTIKLPQ